MDPALQRAKDAAGGAQRLSRLIGVTSQAISQWRRVPANRVLAVERATGLPRHELRPDLYPRPQYEGSESRTQNREGEAGRLPDADRGLKGEMDNLRRVTIQVPERDLERAQELTGAGVSETVRMALKMLTDLRAQQALRALRGSYQFSVDLDRLREDR